MKNEEKSVKLNCYPLYDPDCPICHGTGRIYSILYDPPDECDCWGRFYPLPIVDDTNDNAGIAREL